MKKIFLLFIILLAFFLRFYRYEYFPVGGETADESAWAYLGSSLIQTGKPVSWSHFAPYDDYIVEKQTGAPLVSPALDHPPLFSLIPGFFHSLKNNWSETPSIKLIRLPMVLIGTLNVFLLIILLNKLFKNKKIVCLGGLIYATAPTFVFSSRLVVAENFLVTLALLILLVINTQKNRYKYFLLILLSIIAIFSKVSGIALALGIVLTGTIKKDHKMIFSGIIGGLLGVLLFIAYGSFYNFNLFWAIQASQSERDLGLATFQNRLMLNPTIVAKIFFDGWLTAGLFSIFSMIFLIKKDSKFLPVMNFFIVTLVFIVITAGERTFHGWYDYVLYPLIVVSLSWIIEKMMKDENWLGFGMLWILLLPVIRQFFVYENFYHQIGNMIFRVIYLLGFIPLFISVIKIKNKLNLSQLVGWMLIITIVAFNILAVININHDKYWETNQFFNPIGSI